MPEIATGLSLGVYMVKWHRVGFGEGAPAATFPFKELKGGNNTEGSHVTIRLRNKLHGNTDLQNKNIDREKKGGKKTNGRNKRGSLRNNISSRARQAACSA